MVERGPPRRYAKLAGHVRNPPALGRGRAGRRPPRAGPARDTLVTRFRRGRRADGSPAGCPSLARRGRPAWGRLRRCARPTAPGSGPARSSRPSPHAGLKPHLPSAGLGAAPARPLARRARGRARRRAFAAHHPLRGRALPDRIGCPRGLSDRGARRPTHVRRARRAGLPRGGPRADRRAPRPGRGPRRHGRRPGPVADRGLGRRVPRRRLFEGGPPPPGVRRSARAPPALRDPSRSRPRGLARSALPPRARGEWRGRPDGDRPAPAVRLPARPAHADRGRRAGRGGAGLRRRSRRHPRARRCGRAARPRAQGARGALARSQRLRPRGSVHGGMPRAPTRATRRSSP